MNPIKRESIYLIMKNVVINILFGCFCSVIFFSFKSIDDNILLPVNILKSKVEWTARKIAGKHNGFISISSGMVETDGKMLKGGKFVIDTRSMTDIDVQLKSSNRLLMKHLKYNFFEVDKYPTAIFEISSVSPCEDKYEVVGRLTIKDSTQEIRFPAIISITDKNIFATAIIKLDRRKFDIDYGAGLIKRMANKAIYNDFELRISLVAGK